MMVLYMCWVVFTGICHHYSDAVVGFDQNDYTITEKDYYLQTCLTTNTNLLERDVVVTLSTEDSTAVGKIVQLYQRLYQAVHP